jgi:hypothetical protein
LESRRLSHSLDRLTDLAIRFAARSLLLLLSILSSCVPPLPRSRRVRLYSLQLSSTGSLRKWSRFLAHSPTRTLPQHPTPHVHYLPTRSNLPLHHRTSTRTSRLRAAAIQMKSAGGETQAGSPDRCHCRQKLCHCPNSTACSCRRHSARRRLYRHQPTKTSRLRAEAIRSKVQLLATRDSYL